MNDIREPRLRDEYTARINRVIDYIDAHIDEELRLQNLARVASFSPYHFHRIFGAQMGETLGHYIQRLRVEKAASMLVLNPKKSITRVALDCGFSSSAAFARAFKEAFGMSASQWRSGGHRDDRKMSETDGNLEQVVRPGIHYPCSPVQTRTRVDPIVKQRPRSDRIGPCPRFRGLSPRCFVGLLRQKLRQSHL